MTKKSSHEENQLPAAEAAASTRPEGGIPESAAVARARAEANGLFLFGCTPEEDEIREMYGWGV